MLHIKLKGMVKHHKILYRPPSETGFKGQILGGGGGGALKTFNLVAIL